MKPFFDGYAHRPTVRRALLPLASGSVLQTQGPESVKYVMFWGVRDTILVTSDCFQLSWTLSLELSGIPLFYYLIAKFCLKNLRVVCIWAPDEIRLLSEIWEWILGVLVKQWGVLVLCRMTACISTCAVSMERKTRRVTEDEGWWWAFRPTRKD